jgi:four helix bundle protein
LRKKEDPQMAAPGGYKDLIVYQKAFSLAMKIFHASKKFPKEERFSLTDQIRRSSRAVPVCIAEAYRKRAYQAYFVSKVSDADMENSETQVWLEISMACEYIEAAIKTELENDAIEVGRMLKSMFEQPEKFLPKNHTVD